jgi:hypothetical protein
MPLNKSWREYNESLIERGRILMDIGFLRSSNREIKNMNKGKVGAPFEYSVLSITDVVLSFILVFSCNHGGGYQTVNAQSTGGDVNVLYAGSLISIMETKIGPTFSHLGYNYRGEGHGSIQDANMIVDGQRFPDVFISVGEKPITKLFSKMVYWFCI